MGLIDYTDEDRERGEWATLRYADFDCPNCERRRVEVCANGKHWCEKCDWVIEDKGYFCPDWRI